MDGFYLSGSALNNVTDNNATENFDGGFVLEHYSDSNNLTGNNGSGNLGITILGRGGFFLQGTDGNTLANNNATDNLIPGLRPSGVPTPTLLQVIPPQITPTGVFNLGGSNFNTLNR